MKYVVIIGDGMADYPVHQLGNKTPLQVAKKPNMDFLAIRGITGLVKTIPDNLSPGSDVANLSVMGYDPETYYTGRSPLEAVSMGIELNPEDMAFRCNLVTLSDEDNYREKSMVDYSSDEITSEEAAELIAEINRHLKSSEISFYPGVSYRHCMVWRNIEGEFALTPPHDISGKKIASFLPKGKFADKLLDIMIESYRILKEHPVNLNRISRGLKPANSVWLWGQGRKPNIPSFVEKYNLEGSVISAVDLVKGLGICMGLKSVKVKGATGNIHTNFRGKAEAALQELNSGKDFVYIHVEAPDECGHRYETENKVKAIEYIDEKVVGVLLEGLKQFDRYRILILPDHPTPLSLRTHTSDPVPFVIFDSEKHGKNGNNANNGNISGYDEFQAKNSGIFIEKGHELMDYFIKGAEI